MSRPRLTRRAIERIAENRILQAMREGAFDNLPGSGRPIPGIDDPYDPLWWVRQLIRREKLAGTLRLDQALEHPLQGRRTSSPRLPPRAPSPGRPGTSAGSSARG